MHKTKSLTSIYVLILHFHVFSVPNAGFKEEEQIPTKRKEGGTPK